MIRAGQARDARKRYREMAPLTTQKSHRQKTNCLIYLWTDPNTTAKADRRNALVIARPPALIDTRHDRNGALP
jgi:hypothetical protein